MKALGGSIQRRGKQALGGVLMGLLVLFLGMTAQGKPTIPETLALPIAEPEAAAPAQDMTPSQQAQIHESYGKLPMHFEPNVGQTDPEVKFLARGSGYTLFLTDSEAVLALRKGNRVAPDKRHREPMNSLLGLDELWQSDAESVPPEGAVVRMQFAGATFNPRPDIEGFELQSGYSNYFIGDDPSKWRTNVPNYGRVRYKALYPGIDLVFYGNPRQLEYDFVVGPGADPSAIQLAFQGADAIRVADNGDLILQVAGGELVQQAPKVYQEVNGERRELAGRYVLMAGDQERLAFAPAAESPKPLVGFQVASYAPERPLIIDPVLIYSIYFGGSDDVGVRGEGIAVDSAGNAYVTGYTYSVDSSPINILDAFIFKLNAGGTAVVYSTYLGGSNKDRGFGIAVDSAGNAYVTGSTMSDDFPKVNALYPELWGGGDAFIFKLNAKGNAAVYSTYLGGNDWREVGYAIAVDSAGNAYVTGPTESDDFPKVNALYPDLWGPTDAFIFKLNASGTAAVYSTYLGGSSRDEGRGIAVDSAGNAYVTGWTNSDDFPKVNALYPDLWGPTDAFIFKLNASGTATVYSTYLGGSSLDYGSEIAVDSAGNAYVMGFTKSVDFPLVKALYPYEPEWGPDGFIFKLNAIGTAAVYSTYLRTQCSNFLYTALAVDTTGNAYVIDCSTIIKFNASGTAEVRGYDWDWYHEIGSFSGAGIAVDSAGNAYAVGGGCGGDKDWVCSC